MPERGSATFGRVAKAGTRTLTAADGFTALTQVVSAAQECIKVHQIESTKRQAIDRATEAELKRIKAAEDTLREYFQQVFAERRRNFEALFVRLDEALLQFNSEAVTAVLGSIVDIARTSPIAELGDLSELRAALGDPDKVWDI